jgi:hypothetical protein
MPIGAKLQNRPPGRNEGAPEGGYTGGPDLPGIFLAGLSVRAVLSSFELGHDVGTRAASVRLVR